ncbi:MAG TPA: glycosyltransferase family 2 protein [Ferruginibacter sp.]|nr:glycosyltransferase family 2 protein [Chitinophagaceae bacterium]HRI25578.1 glycosyltransferase family 2 protein [Ferruginibacter sp.]
MGKIGLVTVLFKSDEVLPGFFASVSKQKYSNYILYLIDNSPNPVSDSIIEQCASQYPVTQWKHLKSPGNIGVAEGNNIGIRNALADGCGYVLLLNNDIELEQDFVFGHMVSLCETNGEKIIVPKIFYFDTRKLWMAGGYMNKWRALGIHYGDGKADAPEYNVAKYITYAPTCFMLIESSVFETTGMMDAKYFAYYDDTDFVFRALKQGYKMYYEPSLTVLHKVSSSSSGDSTFYVYYSNRNKIYFSRKNLRGLVKYFAIAYTLFTRVFYYLRFDAVQRKKLVQGLKDGFSIPLAD